MKIRQTYFMAMSIFGVVMLCFPAYGDPALRSQSGGQVKVNVGVSNSLDDIVVYFGKENKYFEKEGLDICHKFGSSNFHALARGTLDVFATMFNANLMELMRESGIRIVAGHLRKVKGKPSARYYLVRKELSGKIRTFADLKGRIVAAPAAGTTEHIWFLRQLGKAGLSENDLAIQASSPDPIIFLNKMVDVQFIAEPWAGQIINMGVAEVFAGTDIADETSQLKFLCYSGSFMKNRQAARRFMAAYLRSIREFYKAKPEDIEVLAVKIWGMPLDAEALSRLHMAADGKIDTQALTAAQEYALQKRWIKSKADEKDIIDSSYGRYANEVLRNEDMSLEQ
ncbi:MAG: ABC transporter substrate-binding protein [bacterium]